METALSTLPFRPIGCVIGRYENTVEEDEVCRRASLQNKSSTRPNLQITPERSPTALARPDPQTRNPTPFTTLPSLLSFSKLHPRILTPRLLSRRNPILTISVYHARVLQAHSLHFVHEFLQCFGHWHGVPICAIPSSFASSARTVGFALQ